METAFATPAVPAPYPLVDLDDLHDADLEGLLAEELSEAMASAKQIADLAGAEAVAAHALRPHLLLLAVF